MTKINRRSLIGFLDAEFVLPLLAFELTPSSEPPVGVHHRERDDPDFTIELRLLVLLQSSGVSAVIQLPVPPPVPIFILFL